MSTKIQQAIQLSLDCLWDQAIDLNLEILQDNPSDISTLNRLAKCYLQIGDKKSAKETYQKVLDYDKYNSVAQKNIKALNHAISIDPAELCHEDFIETPGITRAVTLIKVGDPQLTCGLSCKQKLTLKPKTRLVNLATSSGFVVGSLPDDLSLKLKKLLESGYEYQVCVKSASSSSVSIFIREIKRPSRKSALPSFSKRSKFV